MSSRRELEDSQGESVVASAERDLCPFSPAVQCSNYPCSFSASPVHKGCKRCSTTPATEERQTAERWTAREVTMSTRNSNAAPEVPSVGKPKPADRSSCALLIPPTNTNHSTELDDDAENCRNKQFQLKEGNDSDKRWVTHTQLVSE